MSYDPYEQQFLLSQALNGKIKVNVQPTPALQAWLDLKFGMMLSFGINTFNDCEWSDGTLDPATFNPTALDTDQWCAAAKSAGINFMLLTTKHHDGFCLWPTRWTDYSVQHTPWAKRYGHDGDVVGALAESCRRYGIKLALYYSLWDRHERSYENDHGYAIYMKRQLAELLTRYGPVAELWFDGGWKKGGVHRQDETRWFWREIYEHIKTLQPECVVGNNGTTERPGEIIMYPRDFRIGEKHLPTEKDRKIYYCGGLGDWLGYESDYTLTAPTGKGRFPDGNWFWHADDQSVREPQWVVDQLQACNQHGGVFVINAGPTQQGLLREVDVACLKEVGRLRGV